MQRRWTASSAGCVALIALSLTGCAGATAVKPAHTAPPASADAASLRESRLIFTDAVQRFERGDDEGARVGFRTLLDRYVVLQDYHLAYLARIEERSGRLHEAAEFFERVIDAHEESVWTPLALAHLAWIRLSLGDPRALALADRVLEAPSSAAEDRALALLVQADWHRATEPREAYRLYQAVRSTGETRPAALARERSTELEHTHPSLLSEPKLALAEGRVLTREGRLTSAAERLDAAASSAGADAVTRSDAMRALARVRQRQGQDVEAIATYHRAAAIEPPPGGTAYFDLATMLWNKDRDQEASEVFTTLLRQNPDHPKRDTARYALARIAEQHGQSAEAERLYREVAASGSDDTLVRDARWRLTWMAYRDGRLDDAAAELAALAGPGQPDRPAALYWQGRLRERGEDSAGAKELFTAVLTEAPETYYSELSEQRVGRTLPPPPAPIRLSVEPPASLDVHAYHWTRSQELRAAGLDGMATRELDALARELSVVDGPEPFLLEAYRGLSAHDRALRLATQLTRAPTTAPESLTLYLYPRAYWQLVVAEADAQGIDPFLVLALMRQESAFDPHAVSSAAAHGLMQLLVRTAKSIGDTAVDDQVLQDPATNIHLGTRYLRRLMDRYAGDVPKALAAYNAGEDAVAKWEARLPGSPSDEFVEQISFRETRAYVKTVLGNYRRYRRLYGARPHD